MLLKGKTVAVTGAASGIGRACAEGAAAEGAKVLLIDRADSEKTRKAIAQADRDAESFVCDVRDTGAIRTTFEQIGEAHGGLDVLINCAGTMGNWPKAVADTTDEEWDQVIDTNLKGIFACCRSALPLLRRTPGSAIVNIASELAFVGLDGLVGYCASKAGVVQLSRALAVEEGPNGIRVNAVCPGPVDTPLLVPPGRDATDSDTAASSGPTILKRLGTPQEIANVVVFVASSKASFMTGSAVVVDGGVTAHSQSG